MFCFRLRALLQTILFSNGDENDICANVTQLAEAGESTPLKKFLEEVLLCASVILSLEYVFQLLKSP